MQEQSWCASCCDILNSICVLLLPIPMKAQPSQACTRRFRRNQSGFLSPRQRRAVQLRCSVPATPHTIAMKSAPGLLDSGVTVVDLSADYRLRSQETYEKWYKVQHTSPDLLATAAFGQPELNREELNAAAERHANGESVLVACAGCYQLLLLLLRLPPLPFPKASWLPMQSRVFPALAAVLRHALILFPLTKPGGLWRCQPSPYS